MKVSTEDYESIVNSLKGQLPSLPLVMDELMTIIADPNAALYAIKDIIKLDPSIFSQILKVVNTVQYRGDGEPRISNLNEAMQRLGELIKGSNAPSVGFVKRGGDRSRLRIALIKQAPCRARDASLPSRLLGRRVN